MRRVVTSLLLACVATTLVAQNDRTFPVSDVRPGMVAVGRTVFEGDRLDEFQVHILGVLRNVIGPSRDLILARLDGGPLANAGVIAGMSGSPVYIDGRLLGAVSYSLGQFSKEPIAGITPIAEMVEAATLPGPRRQASSIPLPMPLTPDAIRASLRDAFSWVRPFAESPADVQVMAGSGLASGIGALLRPIATPITLAGFEPGIADPVVAGFRDQGFLPVMAGAQARAQGIPAATQALRPGDPIGVALMSGDLSLGATGTVTDVVGDRVYAFGHPFYNLGPTSFPMTRAFVHVVLASLQSSSKLASMGDVIGTISQDRATTIAGTLGRGPSTIPITLNLASERGIRKTFHMSIVRDQLFTPILAYLSILNTLSSYERENGLASYSVKGAALVKGHQSLAFEDLFSGDQPSVGAAASVIGPINFLVRNTFEDVEIESLTLDIAGSEQARSATLERVWLDGARVRPGSTVDLKVLLRTFRGEEVTRSTPIRIPANARGSLTLLVADGTRLGQYETRELQVQASQTRSVAQMLNVLNGTRKNNRLYVRMLTRDTGALVRGEPLTSLPASVLSVLEADRNGGSFRPIQSALSGDWEIPTEQAVVGSRTLTLPIED